MLNLKTEDFQEIFQNRLTFSHSKFKQVKGVFTMLRLSKMINNTYKEFQARTSEKIADFGTKSI